MNEDGGKSNRRRVLLAAAAVGTLGGAAFWSWRERAPLARSYRRWKRSSQSDRDRQGPNPERNPGTDPV
ncbi:hypothetical protein M0R89_21560 (plasmid) [Halorussus limi]|uniref:Uncharacterized protein n=1 Tax=Halorussus limi TaxID=2938695 RepID=A0A8U0I1L6_9EURY|nr:hypothetical protein [Halorussus limi]UPV76781.1 hypothetical protein M0R89_21560 [Halorussus limi]